MENLQKVFCVVHFFFHCQAYQDASCEHTYSKSTFSICVFVRISAQLCLHFCFIVWPATDCLRELRLQNLFQAEQECPPHYSSLN